MSKFFFSYKNDVSTLTTPASQPGVAQCSLPLANLRSSYTVLLLVIAGWLEQRSNDVNAMAERIKTTSKLIVNINSNIFDVNITINFDVVFILSAMAKMTEMAVWHGKNDCFSINIHN